MTSRTCGQSDRKDSTMNERAKKNRFKKTIVSVKNAVHTVVNNSDVKNVVKLVSDVANVAAPLIDRPSAFNFFKFAFNAVELFSKSDAFYGSGYNYFVDRQTEWSSIISYDLQPIIARAVERVVDDDDITLVSYRDSFATIVDLADDVKIGYTSSSATKIEFCSSLVFAKTSVPNEVTYSKVQNLLWRAYESDTLLLTSEEKSSFGLTFNSKRTFVLKKDELFNPLPSEKSETCIKYLKKCVKSGSKRCLLLSGPPGTGKSTMAYSIAEGLRLRTIRIGVDDLELITSSSTNVFKDCVELFSPGVVILEDIDRLRDQNFLLGLLEFMKRKVDIVIATVNDKKRLDRAVVRPGRFDEIIEVTSLDEHVVKRVLGKENEDAFDVVKDWPIAYVKELVERRKFLDPDDARESVEELRKRIEESINCPGSTIVCSKRHNELFEKE